MTRKDERGHRWTGQGVERAPIRATLHEALEDRVVLALRTVGDLVSCVWNGMEAT